MRAGALYVPPDPNAASGTNELGSGIFAFKISASKFFAGAVPSSRSLDRDVPPTARHSIGRIFRSCAIARMKRRLDLMSPMIEEVEQHQ